MIRRASIGVHVGEAATGQTNGQLGLTEQPAFPGGDIDHAGTVEHAQALRLGPTPHPLLNDMDNHAGEEVVVADGDKSVTSPSSWPEQAEAAHRARVRLRKLPAAPTGEATWDEIERANARILLALDALPEEMPSFDGISYADSSAVYERNWDYYLQASESLHRDMMCAPDEAVSWEKVEVINRIIRELTEEPHETLAWWMNAGAKRNEAWARDVEVEVFDALQAHGSVPRSPWDETSEPWMDYSDAEESVQAYVDLDDQGFDDATALEQGNLY